jgi:hypothetical protein
MYAMWIYQEFKLISHPRKSIGSKKPFQKSLKGLN